MGEDKMIDFTNQTAVVTGAGRGIGREIALLLAKRGAKVVVNNYGGDPEGHAGTSKKLKRSSMRSAARMGRRSRTLRPSATRPAPTESSLERSTAFGRIDILINNAGGSTIAAIDALADEAIERVMRTNYWGPYLLSGVHGRTCVKPRYGRILNVSSPATLGIGTVAPYSSAKAAMIGLDVQKQRSKENRTASVSTPSSPPSTRALPRSRRTMLACGLRLTSCRICVAQAVAYFVSREVKYTGEVFSVGGGRVSCMATFNNDGYFNRELTPELAAEHSKRFAT